MFGAADSRELLEQVDHAVHEIQGISVISEPGSKS